MSAAKPEDILGFWFANAAGDPERALRRNHFWFGSTKETDSLVARLFGPTIAAAGKGDLTVWEAEPRTCLALIVVLDQFPRNVYRGSPEAFAHDVQALHVSRRGLAAGHSSALTIPERAFLLMPFQHAEDAGAQQEGLRSFKQLHDGAAPQWREFAAGALGSARFHCGIIQRFGRFPHRNAILRRTSTPEELAYLSAHSESFGQNAPGTGSP